MADTLHIDVSKIDINDFSIGDEVEVRVKGKITSLSEYKTTGDVPVAPGGDEDTEKKKIRRDLSLEIGSLNVRKLSASSVEETAMERAYEDAQSQEQRREKE